MTLEFVSSSTIQSTVSPPSVLHQTAEVEVSTSFPSPLKKKPYSQYSWSSVSLIRRNFAFALYSLTGYIFVVIAAPLFFLGLLAVYISFGLYRFLFPKHDELTLSEMGRNSRREAEKSETQDGNDSPASIHKKPKFLYITSSGGGTHNALVSAVRGYWKETHSNSEDDVEVETVEAFTQVLRKYDIFPTLTWNTYTGEDLFNWLNSRKANYIITPLYYISENHFLFMRRFMIKTVTQFYEEHQPSVVVSAVPLVSFLFAEAARQKNIPFILIPADADPVHYVRGLRHKAKENPNLRVVIHHPVQGVNRRIERIPENQRILCDYPVRSAFLKPSKYSVEELKSRWEVEEGTHPVGIFMGAGGSDGLMAYVKALSKSDLPLTLLPCCGRSEHLVEKLSAVKCAKNVHVKPVGYISAEKMCEFFDVCEVVIMKPGPSCVREAIQRFRSGPGHLKKLLLDKTTKIQPWEEDNVHQCISLKIGIPVFNINDSERYVRKTVRKAKKRRRGNIPSLQSPFIIAEEMARMSKLETAPISVVREE